MKRLASLLASPLASRAVIAAIALLLLVNAGVLATWSSTHRSPEQEAGGWSPYPGASQVPAETTPTTSAATTGQSVPAPTQPAAASRNATSTTLPASAAQSSKPVKIDPGNFPFELSVSPKCARRLGGMEATVRAVPGAYVSMIVAYSDGHSYGTMYAGPVRPDGTFVLQWKVPATAATGTGHVLASAHDPAANTSGRNVVDFEVVEGKGC